MHDEESEELSRAGDMPTGPPFHPYQISKYL